MQVGAAQERPPAASLIPAHDRECAAVDLLQVSKRPIASEREVDRLGGSFVQQRAAALGVDPQQAPTRAWRGRAQVALAHDRRRWRHRIHRQQLALLASAERGRPRGALAVHRQHVERIVGRQPQPAAIV